MIKDEVDSNMHSIALLLPEGLHTFKFFVDGKSWKYNPEFAFAPDEYGNINNFIKIASNETGEIQLPIETMIRNDDNELPTMNPKASEESMKVRLNPCTATSPVLTHAKSPLSTEAKLKPLDMKGTKHDKVSLFIYLRSIDMGSIIYF